MIAAPVEFRQSHSFHSLLTSREIMLQLRRVCLPEWVDFNNHMRDAYYVLLISFANDQIMDELGLGPRYLKATGHTIYNIDTRIRYLKEAHGGDPLRVDMLLVDADSKRLHLHSTIRNDTTDTPLAVNESILLHVDQAGGPAAAIFPDSIAERVAQRLSRDSAFTPAQRVGDIAIRRR
jgi:acyl-CoA thioester hydrolase